MKYYFDLYIRPAGDYLEALPWQEDGSLDGFRHIDLLDAGAKFSLDGLPRELGDGTELTDGEAAALEAGSLWVTKDAWEELRDEIHNQKCDILLYDHRVEVIVALIYGMQVNVSMLLVSGDSALITLKGTRNMANEGAERIIVIQEDKPAVGEIELSGSLTVFETEEGTPSEAQSYGVKGIDLEEEIRVEAPSGFEVSDDGSNWTDLMKLAADFDGLMYVRMTGAVAGSFLGQIKHSSAGAVTRNLAVIGTVQAEEEPGEPELDFEFFEVIEGAGALVTPNYATWIDLLDAAFDGYQYGTVVKTDSIGKCRIDEETEIDIAAYSITPANYTRTLAITSMIHGDERWGGAGVILLMQKLADPTETSPIIQMLRGYRIFFVPRINMINGYHNYNGVQMNVNYDNNWAPSSISGSAPESEPEVQAVVAWLKSIDKIDFHFDIHNFMYIEEDNFVYRPWLNMNCPYWDDVVELMEILRDKYAVGTDCIPPPPGGGPTCRNYVAEILCVPSATVEIARGWFDTDDETTTRCFEQILNYCLLYSKWLDKEPVSDWYSARLCPALGSRSFGNFDPDTLTPYSAVMDDQDVDAIDTAHNDAIKVYDYDSTDVMAVVRGNSGNPAKRFCVVGTASNGSDYLIIHKAIMELDKYSDKAALSSLLRDCEIVFIPSANPEVMPTHNWSNTSSLAHVIALHNYLDAENFDFVLSITGAVKDGKITVTGNSFIEYLINNPVVEHGYVLPCELFADMPDAGATIYMNNTVSLENYSHKEESHGDHRYASLMPNYVGVILNTVAGMAAEQSVTERVATPILTPNGASFASEQEVSIACATAGASIYYTLDGSEPNESSTLYTAPFTINTNTMLRAKAYAPEYLPSLVKTANYLFAAVDPIVAGYLDRMNETSASSGYDIVVQDEVKLDKLYKLIKTAVSDCDESMLLFVDTYGGFHVRSADSLVACWFNVMIDVDAETKVGDMYTTVNGSTQPMLVDSDESGCLKLEFRGNISTPKLRAVSIAGMNRGAGSVTVCAWVRSHYTDANRSVFFSNAASYNAKTGGYGIFAAGQDDPRGGLFYGMVSDGVNKKVMTNGRYIMPIVSEKQPYAPWTFLAMTYAADSGTVKAYLQAVITRISEDTDFIGENIDSATSLVATSINADIASGMVFTRALSDAEIMALFNVTKSKYGIL